MPKNKIFIEGEPFPKWIMRMRGYTGMSVIEFAKALNVHPNTIINYQQGKTIPPSRADVFCLEDLQERVAKVVSDAEKKLKEVSNHD